MTVVHKQQQIKTYLRVTEVLKAIYCSDQLAFNKDKEMTDDLTPPKKQWLCGTFINLIIKMFS